MDADEAVDVAVDADALPLPVRDAVLRDVLSSGFSSETKITPAALQLSSIFVRSFVECVMLHCTSLLRALRLCNLRGVECHHHRTTAGRPIIARLLRPLTAVPTRSLMSTSRRFSRSCSWTLDPKVLHRSGRHASTPSAQ